MQRSADWLSRWIYILVSCLYFGAVFLRSLLIYRNTPQLGQVLALLLIWFLLAASESFIHNHWRSYFPLYLAFQTGLVFLLLTMPGSPDFFATLLMILSIQAMYYLNTKIGAYWIALCALIITLLLVPSYGAQALALTLIYTAGNILVGSYTLANRRAQAARVQVQTLIQQVKEANHQLQDYARQLEGMAVARERNRLARELHDSVTQTVFSMALTTQSATLLVERDQERVKTQLERLGQLAQSALAEMQLLISELHPLKVSDGGFISALRQHLAGRRLPDNLSVSLHVDGEGPLEPAEEQSLFRILQEALNNIVKHAQTSQADIRLHLTEPFWVEIEDQGQGFDVQQALASGGVGLASMGERAAEIGWELAVDTTPGAGTRIRVEKVPRGGKQV